jgi:YD repeat-containing protein
VSRALIHVLVLLVTASAAIPTLYAQEINGAAMQSEREQRGLRGPVKICLEESTSPARPDADGKLLPEWTSRYTTEYDREGRLLSTRWRNPNGTDWVTQYAYNSSGQLLKASAGTEGQQPTEQIYHYDAQGRLLSIQNTSQPDNPVIFRYDEQGRKTKVQTSRPEDYSANVVAGNADSPFFSADRAPNIEGGGTATTIYDEHDRPVEVQIRDAQGDPVSRAERTYDDRGRVLEEKIVYDDITTMLPASARAKILETPGASLDDLREQLKQVLGKGSRSPSSIAFTYDARGCITRKIRRVFNMESIIDITCNEQGDPVRETTRTLYDDGKPGEYSETHYAYQYDEHGHWTEKVDSYCSAPGCTLVPSTKTRRTLTYF